MTTSKRVPSFYSTIGRALLLVAALVAGCGQAAGGSSDDGHAPPVSSDADAGATDVRSADSQAVVDTRLDVPTAPRSAVAFACTSDEQCESGHCADGVCCDTACDGSCTSCALTGKVGVCSPVTGTHDDTCDGDSICDAAGICLSALGTACETEGDCASGNCVDGVCCSSSACGTCQSCAVPGSLGACAPVAKFTDDADTCTGQNTCNGLGGCQRRNGSRCDVASQCASQECVDGVCCDQACSGTCYACNQGGSEGTCRPLNNVKDPSAESTCVGTRVCSLRGAVPVCKLSDGFPCTTSDDCASSVCSTSYQDEDGDGYGGTTAVHRCGTQIPPGYAPRADDCCDQDALSSPGATIARNFRNRCGSYDWDCNGIEESQSGGTVK